MRGRRSTGRSVRARAILTLTRDVTTEVTVVNRLRQPTGVHWHGLELESYSDGVLTGGAALTTGSRR